MIGWREFEIDHLGVAVRSIDAALEFWAGALGVGPPVREVVPEEKMRMATLPVGDSSIELLEPTEADSPVGRFLAKRGPGLHHVALRTSDLAVAVERLKSAGAKLVGEPRRGAGGRLYVFVHPVFAGGVLLELVQNKSHSE